MLFASLVWLAAFLRRSVRVLPRVTLALAFALFAATAAHRAHAAGDVPLGAGIETVMMDPHMQMTVKRDPKPGDRERADAILSAARAVMAKYGNVADAEADGYAKFLPTLPLPIEHYTSRANAVRAAFGFDPSAPTSLIYERTPKGLVLAGVMYTAPNRASAADLDAKVPMSIGSWHRHVDFCWSPTLGGTTRDPRFGMEGSIHDRASCDAAGGRFTPLVFNWMLHVWPNETAPQEIWAVDHGHEHAMGMVGTPAHSFTTLPIAPEKLPVLDLAADDIKRGADIFAANCASCHGTAARNGPDAPALAGAGLRAGQVAYMVRHPRDIDATSCMPALPISDGDVADVAAYVASLK